MHSHKELCSLAVTWLKRPYSAGGPGCAVALSECRTGSDGEVPDAIGFRTGHGAGSVLIEVKTSRADFLADRAKPHRQQGGVGDWRYFMVPEGLLSVADLPARWGLLEVNSRGYIKARAGLALYYRCWGDREAQAEAWRFSNIDHGREQHLLVRALANTDPQSVLERVRNAQGAYAQLLRRLDSIAQAVGLPKGASSYEVERVVGMLKGRTHAEIER